MGITGYTTTTIVWVVQTTVACTSPTVFVECGEQFYDSYQENYSSDMTREVAESAPVREPPFRPAYVRRRKIKIRAYRRSRPRVPDRQWFEPIKANAPPRSS